MKRQDIERSLTQLLGVMRKEVRQTVRDRRMMFLLLVAPALQLVVFASAVDFDVDRVPTVLVDQDQSPASRAHLSRLLADGTLKAAGSTLSVEEAEKQLEAGEASVAVVIPPGHARSLARGEPAPVQLLLDGSDPNRSGIASGAAAGFFARVSGELVQERMSGRANPSRASISLIPRVLYNPQLSTPVYMVPGIMAMLLVIVTTIVTAMGLAREREMGTLEQVLVTPIPSVVLLVGKLLPFVLVGLFDVALALVTGSLLFEVPLRGSLLFLTLSTGSYLLTTLGVGLLISTVSTSQQQAFMSGFLFMMPAILLSGIMTPIHSMPEWMQPLTLLNPVRYFAGICRAVLLRGAGWMDLCPSFVILTLYGLLILGVASWRFQKRSG